MKSTYDLQRFVTAQEAIYTTVLHELRGGEKRSHWMWYIFPQIGGLGHSVMAKKYAITSHEEAKAYLQHPVLGSRLRECTGLVVNLTGRSAEEIFAYPDNLKFRSSMTLFSEAITEDSIFHKALLKYFEGMPDPLTLYLLKLPGKD
jgi:uncharacterized protein (DUF1810 family)